jgi:hypothetical protein
VVSYAGKGTVYAFRPGSGEDQVVFLKPQPAIPRPGMMPVLPVDYWQVEDGFMDTVPVRNPFQYVSPDGTTFIPADEDFFDGALFYGAKLNSLLRAFGLAPAVPGRPFYVCDESEQKTYAVAVEPDGSLSAPRLFAELGGEAVTTDGRGNVFIAAGQVYVYDPAGRLTGTIEVPERPIGLAFGGRDGQTLFILARTSLYSVRPP